MLENIDWPIIASALATFITTVWLAHKGWKDAKSTPESNTHTQGTLLSASLQDNASIRNNTEQLRIMNHNMEELVDQMRLNHAAMTRMADITLMTQGQKRR